MIELESITLRVQVIPDRDIDRQSENLQNVKGYIDLDFERGMWGDPDYFLVKFEAKGFQLERTKAACEKAINRARKVKSNDESDCYKDDFNRLMKHLRDNAKPMRIYFAQSRE